MICHAVKACHHEDDMKNEEKPDWLKRAAQLRRTELIWIDGVSESTVRRGLRELPGKWLIRNRGKFLYVIRGAMPNLKLSRTRSTPPNTAGLKRGAST